MSTEPSDDPNWAWLDRFDTLIWDLSLAKGWQIKAGFCWSDSAVLHVACSLLWNQWGWLRQALITVEAVQEDKWDTQRLLGSCLRTSTLSILPYSTSQKESQSWAQRQNGKALQRCMICVHWYSEREERRPFMQSATGPNHTNLLKT